jgi:hypothetical protein
VIGTGDETFSGARSFDAAMAEYQSARDDHVLPFYEFTTQIAALEPPTLELAQLLAPCTATRRPWTGSFGSLPA